MTTGETLRISFTLRRLCLSQSVVRLSHRRLLPPPLNTLHPPDPPVPPDPPDFCNGKGLDSYQIPVTVSVKFFTSSRRDKSLDPPAPPSITGWVVLPTTATLYPDFLCADPSFTVISIVAGVKICKPLGKALVCNLGLAHHVDSMGPTKKNGSEGPYHLPNIRSGSSFFWILIIVINTMLALSWMCFELDTFSVVSRSKFSGFSNPVISSFLERTRSPFLLLVRVRFVSDLTPINSLTIMRKLGGMGSLPKP
ncbi:unnamed protein product [Arabis nemorensis]|uniref:Uncharacterized protein n=1 Tax=Arabis nemorensis TaxID=586526 RepID=A0A565AUI5_9BRAS|nr:unnamed protein product [Arabis nemorensis]